MVVSVGKSVVDGEDKEIDELLKKKLKKSFVKKVLIVEFMSISNDKYFFVCLCGIRIFSD